MNLPMQDQRTLLAIEAMMGVDEMAAAASSYGYQLTVLTEDPAYYGKTNADIIPFPTRDYDALETYISENREVIHQVFSVTDTWGVVASRLRDSFGFYQFGDTAALTRLRNKDAVQQALIDNGLAYEPQSWPRIVKPVGGTGKIGVQVVRCEAELEAFYAREGLTKEQYVLQNFYYGPMYSAELWRDGNFEVFFGVTNRVMSEPPFLTERVKSFPWSSNTIWENRVKEWVFRVLDAVDYRLGLAHVEFIETKSGFELVEINARMAGALVTHAIPNTTNYNPYRMTVEQALGLPITVPDARIVSGGYSHVSVYAPIIGTIRGITGADEVEDYPGNPAWIASRHLGDHITDVGTYRGRIGNVVATAETAHLAQDRALSAAQNVEVVMDGDNRGEVNQ